MNPHPAIGPAPARRAPPGRRTDRVVRATRGALVLVAALSAFVVGQGDAASPMSPTACGEEPGFGVVARSTFTEPGRLALSWTLFAAPVPALLARPLVFVDGRLAVDLGPTRLVCDRETRRELTGLDPDASSVHALLHGWPPVPSDLQGMSFDEARRAYADVWPPGTYAMADVEWWRPSAVPAPEASRVDASPAPPGALIEDRVDAWPEASDRPRRFAPAGPRLVRAPVGTEVPIRLTYASFEAGLVLATCLLDGVQVPAFDGEVARRARLVPDGVLEMEGSVRVPAAGWHRLHCLLLPDDPEPTPFVPPRPLAALYVYGDAP